MKIIVVGATGFIGSDIYRNFYGNFDTFGTSSHESGDLTKLNLNDPDKFDYSRVSEGDTVILTAAISSPDLCDSKFEYASAINVHGTRYFIEMVIRRGARVLFLSSDTVYGEQTESFDESAAVFPAGKYAEMKHAVESLFIGNIAFKALRLSYVFASTDKFTAYLAECAKSGREAEIFHPFFRSFIHKKDVVDGVAALVHQWESFPQQIINFGGPEVLSRLDAARILKQTVFPSLCYREVTPSETFFLNRPKVIALKSPILAKLLGRPVKTLADAAQIEFLK